MRSGWKNGIVSVVPMLFDAGEAEVDVSPPAPTVRGLQAELLRAILVLGERQRVDHVEHELAARARRRELLEHLAHAVRSRRAAAAGPASSWSEKKRYRLIGSSIDFEHASVVPCDSV